ncbi:MAG: PD-(D/E)XK nuclease family protein [Chloroflexi bacterium]|nr:MAG: PD-(D/E)XK nuclease family protein [Chloroflexota bacterium]
MSLSLPPTFAFSQSSLQAYANCPRRFWLAYVEQLPWPSQETKPFDAYEEQMRLGSRFHQAILRAETGFDPELLAATLDYPLDEWFAAYRRHRPDDLPTQFVESERVLSIPFGNENGRYRLAARYDLIAAERAGEQARAVIIDWKTTSRPTRRERLQQQLQTVVYPFVLVEASDSLPWGALSPAQVEMRYWFTAAPDAPVIFRYSADLHAANRTRLQGLLGEILAGTGQPDFPKAPDTEQNRQHLCAYCVYRSRCDRGVEAGDLAQVDDADFFVVDLASGLEFTLDDVEALAF